MIPTTPHLAMSVVRDDFKYCSQRLSNPLVTRIFVIIKRRQQLIHQVVSTLIIIRMLGLNESNHNIICITTMKDFRHSRCFALRLLKD